MAARLLQRAGGGDWPGPLQAVGDQFEFLPVLPGPVDQQVDTGLRQAGEGLFDALDLSGIGQAGPAHGQLAGLAEPGQPAPFLPGEIHLVTA